MTVDEARIHGGGAASPRFTARTEDERVQMIDRYLAEHPDDVMILEVKADGERWRDDLAPREALRALRAGRLPGFLQVGVHGDVAAARLWGNNDEIRATYTPSPARDRPPVFYDDHTRSYFLPEAVVPLAEVRQLMIHYAHTGEWLESVSSRLYDEDPYTAVPKRARLG